MLSQNITWAKAENGFSLKILVDTLSGLSLGNKLVPNSLHEKKSKPGLRLGNKLVFTSLYIKESVYNLRPDD